MGVLEALAKGAIITLNTKLKKGNLITIEEGFDFLRKRFPNEVNEFKPLTNVKNFQIVRSCGYPVVFALDLLSFIEKNDFKLIAIKGAGTREEGDRLVGFFIRN